MNNDNRESRDIHKRRERDSFFVILMGLISYGVILIAIVIGTFFLVKKSFEKKDAQVMESIASNDNIEIVENEDTKDPEAFEPSQEAAGQEEEELPSHVISAENYMTQDGKLDYSKILFKPVEREDDLKWNDTVFSRIENVKEPDKAQVNTYQLTMKRVRLADDLPMEIQIYKNPDTDMTEKITTVEHWDDRVEVIDYYYDNDVINYVAQRSALIDYPIDISSGKVTSRYYFSGDALVRYSYCEDNKATVFNAVSLGEYSQGTIDQYKYLESEMINRAYITYNAAQSIEERQYIEGYVLDEYDQALVDVNVKLYDQASMSEVASAMTNGDGHYEMDIPVDDEGRYFVSVSKDEFDETRIYGITAKSGSGVYYIPTPRLTYASDGAEYNEQILVRDGEDNNTPLSDATLNLRAGLNSREGDVIASSVLDQGGSAVFTLQSGNYTAEVSREGYEKSYFNVIVTMSRQITVGYAVKDVADQQLKAVLTWDATPLDLDSRVITAGGKGVIKPSSDGTGSITCETITLDISGSNVYSYYVSDHTNCIGGDPNSGSMTGSGSVVTVYGSDGYMTSLSVPMGHLGVVWEPFIVRKGTVIPINEYYNVIEQNSYWTAK